jgi:hypothetical protein
MVKACQIAGTTTSWTTDNRISQRTEDIHLVANKYTGVGCENLAGLKQCGVAPFGNTTHLGRFKLIACRPGRSSRTTPAKARHSFGPSGTAPSPSRWGWG